VAAAVLIPPAVISLEACVTASGSGSRPYRYNANPLADSPVTGRGVAFYHDVVNDFYGYADDDGSPHRAIDWEGSEQEPVIAAIDGIVASKGKTSRGSLFIGIDSGLDDGGVFRSEYVHLSGFNGSLSVYDKVKRGDLLGFVGNTGTNESHLHFNLKNLNSEESNKKEDPMLFGVLYPSFLPSIPLYDFKADLVKVDFAADDADRSKLILQQLNERDVLDKKLGNYDGSERQALQDARGNISEMKRLLLGYTAISKNHVPGSPVYTVMLEVFTHSSKNPIALTHPLMDPNNSVFAQKYDAAR
jgi:murein DD-endopeptidase MepM/ murein hydrolase activator NlpD